MAVPDDLKYAQTHEWFRVEGDLVTMGITQFAADELTDITYVELPEPGKAVDAGGSIGEIESVKATSEIYSAVSGEISERNEKLESEPELVNNDPFGEGWMVKIKTSDQAPLEKLMDAAAYQNMLSQ